MVMRGINVTVKAVQASVLPVDSLTVLGIIGTGEAGNPMAVPGVPVAVNTLEKAEEQFGSTGSLIDACKAIYGQVRCWVVGVRYDHTIATPADLLAAQVAAINSFLSAASETGLTPSVIGAPGLTYLGLDDDGASPIVTKLKEVAESLGAYVVADSANSTIAVAEGWQNNNGGSRVIPIPQRITTPDTVNLAGSGHAMGAIAKNDSINGVKDSVANRPLSGIVSVNPAYTFSFTDGATEAQVLAVSNFTVYVREGTEWIFVGGTTPFVPTGDPRRFMNAGRVFDQILARMKTVGRSYLSRQLTTERVGRIISAIQNYLNTLIAAEDIITGTVSPDIANNTIANLDAGKLFINLSIDFVANLEQLNLSIEVS